MASAVYCPESKRRKWMCGYMRLKATRAMEEHMLLLLRTGEFLSKVYRLRSPAIFDQSLDWSKNRPKGVCPSNRMNIKKI